MNCKCQCFIGYCSVLYGHTLKTNKIIPMPISKCHTECVISLYVSGNTKNMPATTATKTAATAVLDRTKRGSWPAAANTATAAKGARPPTTGSHTPVYPLSTTINVMLVKKKYSLKCCRRPCRVLMSLPRYVMLHVIALYTNK